VTLTLPARYKSLTPDQRREARREYARLQDGKCHYCKGSLAEGPPPEIQSKPINWRRFPQNFLRWPLHLHHSHDSGMTIGVVHARCNAVLWEYHGE
jgi:hypothetical protein